MCTSDCGPTFSCVPEDSGEGWSTGPDIALITGCEGGESDPYGLLGLAIELETLVATVSYSGGCEEHPFRACWDEGFMESSPVQARLDLQHENNDDTCEAGIMEDLRISLRHLRLAYEEAYGTDTGSILVNLGEESILFEFDACTGEELPECPPACPDDGFSRCGDACDPALDVDCGNDIGDAMACVECIGCRHLWINARTAAPPSGVQ